MALEVGAKLHLWGPITNVLVSLNSYACVSLLRPQDMMSRGGRGSVGVSVGTGCVWGSESWGRLPVLHTENQQGIEN